MSRKLIEECCDYMDEKITLHHETKLESWLQAADVAYTMGSQHVSGDVAKILAFILLAEKKNILDEFWTDYREANPAVVAFEKRFNTEIYPDFALPPCLIAYICETTDRFGSMFMLGTFLHLRRARTMSDLLRLLPNGIPAEDALGMLWSLQKHSGPETDSEINLIDQINSVNSLYKKLHKETS
ncbi:hypothetical protein YOLOSWAG_12 [Erwinia phage vB_EamM_Yoloswag]|uniref:Uncharacterized protein n=1 Tax=Erwinia phage vB_EamM_Yoloswag TaxID=1958956 RepID=A0A1S6L2W0_9CAUD|nr:hypothetical protein HOR66_gp012 [Erwinia phage vB_EamM_Yoloswag]AQT28499.1 hypothetical protein YOLOSWAG_12 [Erwinia phage vB_EamM_Yoloswag]